MGSKWIRCCLGDIVEFRNGVNFTRASEGSKIKVVGVGDFQRKEVIDDFSSTTHVTVNGEVSTDDLLANDDLLFVRSNGNKALVGRCVLVRGLAEPITFSGFTIRARITADAVEPRFLSKLVRSSLFWQHLHWYGSGSSINNLSQEVLRDFRFALPPIAEQRKIAKIIGVWDEANSKLDAISRRLDQLQAALRQKLFEKQLATDGQLPRASSIFEAVSERARPDLPLLAVMQDLGVIRRDDLDRRVTMPEGGISGYKVVRPGDFIISLRSFEGGLEFSNVLGLVSPAYTVLRSTKEANNDYYRHFFKSRSFIGRLDKLIFGIRDGKQIAFRDFGDMRIPYPAIAEQETTAKLLNKVAQERQLNEQRKSALEAQRRGLMQKLLTGEWRLKC